MTTPDWLNARGGEMRRELNDFTWLVLVNGSQQYKLVLTPTKGKFGCAITQTNNGRRLDKGTGHSTAEAALRAGLAELREALGW